MDFRTREVYPNWELPKGSDDEIDFLEQKGASTLA
jgi:hypothetical protein